MSKSYNIVSTKYMFNQYPKDIDLSAYDLTSVEDASFMFALTEGAITLGAMAPTSMNDMFSASSVTSLDLTLVDVSNVTTLSRVFDCCKMLTSLDVSNWNLANVESFYLMFNHVESLRELDLSSWTIPSGVNSSYMFSACSELVVSCSDTNVSFFEGLGYSDTDNIAWFIAPSSFYTVSTSGIASLSDDFKAAINLATPVQYKNWAGGAIPALPETATNTYSMFSYLENMRSIDVSGFITSNITDIGLMFENCVNLTAIDISSWDISDHIAAGDIFTGCTITVTVASEFLVELLSGQAGGTTTWVVAD